MTKGRETKLWAKGRNRLRTNPEWATTLRITRGLTKNPSTLVVCIFISVSNLLNHLQTYKLLTKAHYFMKVTDLMHKNADLLPDSWVSAMRDKLCTMLVEFPHHMVWNFGYLRDHHDLSYHRQVVLSQSTSPSKFPDISQELLEFRDPHGGLAHYCIARLQTCAKVVLGTKIADFYHEFSLTVKKIYDMIFRAKMADKNRDKDAPQSVVNSLYRSIQFPKGCLFPSLDQMKIRLPEENLANYDPLPQKAIFIKPEPPVFMKCFESKDVPCLLKFGLVDGSERSLIFKVLTNSLPEALTSSFLENTFFRDKISISLFEPGLREP